MLKEISISTNDIYQYDLLKEVVWNHFAKAAITGAFHSAFHHSIKKVSKIEIVHSEQIPQNTVKI